MNPILQVIFMHKINDISDFEKKKLILFSQVL